MVKFLTPLFFFAMALIIGGSRAEEFALIEASMEDVHGTVDAGALTYERLTALYLARIAAHDRIAVHAVLTLNPGAVADAMAMDTELRTTGTRRSALHGIPVFLKDLIDRTFRLALF